MKNLVLALMVLAAPLAYSQTVKTPVYSVVPMQYTMEFDENLIIHYHISFSGEANHTYVLQTATYPEYITVNEQVARVPSAPCMVTFELYVNPFIESKAFWIIGFVPKEYRQGTPMNKGTSANTVASN